MKLKVNQKLLAGFILILIIVGILCGSYYRALDHYGLSSLDFRFRHRPQIPASEKIVFVDIADDTIDYLGQFPIDRSYHGVLVQALSRAGAEAVVFDIFFSEPQNDEEFELAVNLAGNVYFPHVFSLDSKDSEKILKADGFVAQTMESFTQLAKGTGHINILPDSDGKFRRVPLLIQYDGRYYPYMSFQVILDSLNLNLKDIKVDEGRSITLSPDIKIPLDRKSNMLINFTGPWGTSYKHYSYVDVIKSHVASISGEKPPLDLSIFKDKICLIGFTAEGTTDLHPTPFEALYPAVGIHAEVMNAILQNNFVARASKTANLLILLCLLAFIIWASIKSKPLKAFYFLLGELAVFLTISLVLFNVTNLWIDVLYPFLSMVIVYGGCTLFKYIAEWKKTLVMENELQIARTIQESFLPKTSPQTHGLDTAAAMITARRVGGDLYDFLEFDENKLGVMIGDVTGKGVPASLFMAMTVSAFKFFANLEAKPEESLLNLNNKIRKESKAGLFVTMYYSIFDMENKTMSYASGGHNPTLYLPRNNHPVQFLDVKDGPPVGVIKSKFSGNQIKFEKGDCFVFYTDGITEARNKKGEMYTEERLISIAQNNKQKSAKEILDSIVKDVFRFEPKSRQHDDVTCIVIKVVD